jgi:hypothetical protein
MVSDSLGYLVSVIYCCEIYEKLYSGLKIAAAEHLNGSLVNLYVSVLEYLWRAKQHLQKGTASKLSPTRRGNEGG